MDRRASPKREYGRRAMSTAESAREIPAIDQTRPTYVSYILRSRDYYIAQHRLGAECWAFVDVDAQWYLHGYFG